MHILIVEDDPVIAELLERGLREEGHATTRAPTLAEAHVQTAVHRIDLLIVDRGLPDGDGLDLVRRLRSDGATTPVVILTARDRTDERIEGLYGGADDYLVKPFVFDELLARIAAVARRARSATSGRITVGDLVIDTLALRTFRGDAEVHLTAQEFRLLRYLAEHEGHVQTRTRLLDAVWDLDEDPGSNVVDVYVSYLRAKIDRGHEARLLHTVRGVGYVLEDRR